MANWIELECPYSTENVLIWLDASWMTSGFGVRFRTPCRMALVTSRPSTIHMFATRPWPLALASTSVSVEKLSTPDPGEPPAVVPIPETPGATVTRENMLRPASGRLDSSCVSSVIWFRVSLVLTSGVSAVTVTVSASVPTLREMGTFRFWFVSRLTVASALAKPAASTVIL